jgi:hypothetical protein
MMIEIDDDDELSIDENEQGANSLNRTVSSSSSQTAVASIVQAYPFPQLNESDEDYFASLIPFIYNLERDTVDQLQAIGSIKLLIDLTRNKTKDHPLIKNIGFYFVY